MEMQELLKPYNFELLSLKDINFSEEIEENGTTFLENSLIKAKTIALKTSLDVLSDDSGIIIENFL